MKRPLLVFTVLAFGLSWAVALPLWFGGGLGSPLMLVLGALMMFTPSVGVLGVWAVSRTPFREFARQTGLTLGERKGRTAVLVLTAWLGCRCWRSWPWGSAPPWGWSRWTSTGSACSARPTGRPARRRPPT
ncbi:hypothetical protein ACFQ0B_64625 [Nonomuraea thailandensis]